MITSAQLRAARALLRWSAEDLAARAKIGVATIRRAEATDGPLVSMTAANQQAVQNALEGAGVIFVPSNGQAEGVRLRKEFEAPILGGTRVAR